MKRPLISFITPMKEQDFRVIKLFESIKRQNYPQDRIELIITDGGSNPEVLKACKKYGAQIYHNPKGYAEGAGMGKDQGIWKATGEFVVIAESDLELIGDNWINDMLKPFEEHKDLFGSVPRLYVNPQDNMTNRYLSYVGVDPFAIYRSLEGQLTFNKHLKKEHHDHYDVLELDPKEPLCMGSNGFMFRRSLIKEVGDYAQDIEFIARLAKKGHTKFAVVEHARIWHKNVKSFKDFLRKRVKWMQNYLKSYIFEKKEFNWIDNKLYFFLYTFKNLLFVPSFLNGINKAIEYRDTAWLLHGPLVFLSTLVNIYFTLTSKKMFMQLFQ